MQISPQLQDILQLAGHMLAHRCATVVDGRTPGADLGRYAEGQTPRVTLGDPRDHLLPARWRALMAAAPWPDAMALVLVHARTLEMAGTPFTRALVAEIVDAAGQLDGLVFALPFQPAQGKEPVRMHSIRIVDCPPALRPLSDDLLIAVGEGAKAMAVGHAAWMSVLHIEPGVTPVPPTDARDPALWAAAITPGDPHPHSGGKVTAHLDAFFAEGSFEGGLAFEAPLRALRFDFSLTSLVAVDGLLDRLRQTAGLRREAFLASPPGRNFVHLVAAYLGETLVLATRALVTWYTPRQLEAAHPGRLADVATPSTSLVALLDAVAGAPGIVLPASDLVAGRLFGDPGAVALSDAASVAAGEVRAARPGVPVDPGQAWNAATSHGPLRVMAPDWFSRDPVFQRWFAALPTLWRDGTVVWSQLVQANNVLFKKGAGDAPGEVLYDPSGRVDPRRFPDAAAAMYGLKGLRLCNPWLAFFAQALTHERTRTSGLELPARLGARGLQTASLLFFRAHLRDGMINGGRMPMLVSPELPGIVMMLPADYWPEPT